MSSRSIRTFACAALFLPLVACGDDDSGPGGSTMTSEAAATSSVDSALAFGAVAQTPQSESSLASALSIYASAQTLSANAQAEGMMAKDVHRVATQALLKAYDPACATTTGNTTTYSDCDIAPTTFNGTVSTSGDDITVDITADVDPSAYNGPLDAATGGAGGAGGVSVQVNSVTVREQGTLTVTTTSLDGVLDVDIDISMTVTMPVIGEQTTNQNTSLNIDYDSLVIANGCATGGTLAVDDGSYAAIAMYGPACGDVSVEYR